MACLILIQSIYLSEKSQHWGVWVLVKFWDAINQKQPSCIRPSVNQNVQVLTSFLHHIHVKLYAAGSNWIDVSSCGPRRPLVLFCTHRWCCRKVGWWRCMWAHYLVTPSQQSAAVAWSSRWHLSHWQPSAWSHLVPLVEADQVLAGFESQLPAKIRIPRQSQIRGNGWKMLKPSV